MLEPGSRIDDYELVRRSAAGATSEVYEGRHVQSGRRVAVKVLHDEWCLDADIVARFLKEACVLQHVQHPRVVTAVASGFLKAGPPFLILEWLPVNLGQALAHAGGVLRAPAALRVAAQIAEALAALHELGIIHRDLKPANVLADQEDLALATLKLADFGLAKVPADMVESFESAAGSLAAVHVSTAGNAMLGTWDYMAPEQWIRAKDVEPKTDVYALGALLFQLLTGRPPFVAEQQKDLMYFHLLEEPPLHLLEGIAPDTARDLIRRMLSKSSLSRPTMHEVLQQLTAAARTGTLEEASR